MNPRLPALVLLPRQETRSEPRPVGSGGGRSLPVAALRTLLAGVILLLVPPAVSAQPAAPYAATAEALTAFLDQELPAKGLPALSIALVDDQRVVWAKGFGIADPKAKKPATADTVYRVGSVSKLFTDIGVM